MKKQFYFLISFLVLLVVWQLAPFLFDLNKALFPTPTDILLGFTESKELFSDITISLFRLVVGSFIGIIVAIFFGIITGHVATIETTFGRICNFLRFIPPLALVPLFLLWFGIGEISKISLLAWNSFFPTWISVHNGVKNIESKYMLVAKSLKVRKFYFMKDIVLKGAMDYILSGARVGIGFAFNVLVAAEMLGAYAGVGYRIFFLQSVYRVDRMIGYILIIGVIGLLFDKIFLVVSKRSIPWKNAS